MVRPTGSSAKRGPASCTGAGSSAVSRATAPPGGCSARISIIAAIAAPTATAAAAGGGTSVTTASATSDAVTLPATADHGWASGEFGTQKTRTAVAPSGATRDMGARPADAAAPTIRAQTPMPKAAPSPARICSRPAKAGIAGSRWCQAFMQPPPVLRRALCLKFRVDESGSRLRTDRQAIPAFGLPILPGKGQCDDK
ncbi:hypothetical protein GCM10011392_40510 [Wenxinia marina]|nr:hypothetical protein GCM10011392_40510 [Wenxinia marina]